MSAETRSDVDLAHYGGLVRRRWVILLAGLLAGLGLAAAALAFVPKSYTSTASVLVMDTGVNGAVENGRTSGAINLDTEAQIMTSVVVGEIAREAIESDESARDLTKRVAVTVPPNTSVLNVAFTADSAEQAQAGADAFAQAYLTNRTDEASSRLRGQTDALEQRIGALNQELQELDETLENLAQGSPERAYQSSQRTLLVEQIEALNARSVDLTSLSASGGSVITAAQLPPRPSDPDRKLLVASGVLAGLFAGIVCAFVVDRFDRRVRERADLERLGLDVLVGNLVVPTDGVIAASMSSRNTAESLRQLRNALLAQVRSHRRSIMVAGMSPDSVGSAVALNLAATMARSGLDVILVISDSRAVSDSELNEGSDTGLADLLQGRVETDQVIHAVQGEPGLRMLLPGADGSLYSELLQQAQLGDLLDELKQRAEVIILDVAPVSANADAQTLATLVDGVLLVAAEKQTTSPQVIEAIDQLGHVSANVLGSVLATPAPPHTIDRPPQFLTDSGHRHTAAHRDVS